MIMKLSEYLQSWPYIQVLCTYGITVLCPWMLLANVYVYVLCIYYICMWILAPYGSMYISMCGTSITLHPLSCKIKKNVYFQWYMSYSVISCSAALWYIVLYSLASVIIMFLCLNIYIGFCNATVGDDKYGLGGDRFEGHVGACVSVVFPGPLLY